MPLFFFFFLFSLNPYKTRPLDQNIPHLNIMKHYVAASKGMAFLFA